MLANLSLKTYFFIEVIEPAFVKITTVLYYREAKKKLLTEFIGQGWHTRFLDHSRSSRFWPIWTTLAPIIWSPNIALKIISAISFWSYHVDYMF